MTAEYNRTASVLRAGYFGKEKTHKRRIQDNRKKALADKNEYCRLASTINCVIAETNRCLAVNGKQEGVQKFVELATLFRKASLTVHYAVVKARKKCPCRQVCGRPENNDSRPACV
eukprot:CAMPEP_0113665474 /NCGR_PEP_ID=MMETSP0038_2-20120614/2325_1 /TAXON_ID=2898 /ORGANISM="Cryptomonas paramecium" /LENGTH=115 /DNA_ID=CAMNT_0000580831 /DNA_START=120 /DNA_END=464 /DNA_ORIENTATION=- /assembly_acc=CAM_ASM_000170